MLFIIDQVSAGVKVLKCIDLFSEKGFKKVFKSRFHSQTSFRSLKILENPLILNELVSFLIG